MRLTDKEQQMMPSEAYGHDTSTMDFLASDGDWDIFGFGPTHSCHTCLAPVGGLFLIFDHQTTGATLMTPCMQNDATFELAKPDGDVLIFGHLDELLALGKSMTGLTLPSKTTFWANLRWFVDHPEARSREALFGSSEEQDNHDPRAIH